MGKRNTVWARNSNRRVRSKDKGSDESDEDYVISDEDEEESEPDMKEYASSLDGEEESFDGFDAVDEEEVDEVEQEADVMLRHVEWPKVKTGPRGNRKITGCKSRKVNQVVSDDEDVDLDDADEEEVEVRDSRKTVGRSNVKAGSLDGEKCQRIGLGKRRRVFYEVEDEDGDYPEEDGEEEGDRGGENVSNEKMDLNPLHDGEDGEDGEMATEEQDNVSHEIEEEDDGDYENEDDDEDFTADEDISLDEEEEEEETTACNKRSLLVCKKNKRKQRSRGGRKRRKKSSAKPRLTRGRKRRGKDTKKGVDEDDDGDFVDDCLPTRKKAKTRSSRSRRRCTMASDSDIASSGESDYEYTISEEEREQIREAGSLLRSNVKHVSSIRQTTVIKDLPQPRKSPVKKSEKKVVEPVKKDVMKNVCGICLSEEDMRRLRGTLDCCSHYFCFTCIMEWSKVESRCPLCKQRFRTISKPARSTPGVDLREVVIPVPERDQVYQPTEEELRSYLDPYENTICTECHQGEDDGLMLLCDLCDSSAHTYCVGLGREVPEGNWYCEGCRPVALGSASSHTHTTSEQQRVSGLYNRPSPLVVSGLYQDASSLVSPRTPFYNGEYLFSPRLPIGDGQGTSPSGLGATTLSRRRTLHRHIQNIINSDRLMNMGSSRIGGTSIANSSDGFMSTQVGHGRETEPSQPAVTQGTGMSLYTVSEERLPSNNSLISLNDPDHFGSQEAVRRLSNNTFLGDRPLDLRLGHGLDQGVPLFGNQQHLPRYLPNTVSSTAGERLQQRVKAHLKKLSSQIDLGQATFDEISTCSIHTILAACGLEHKSSEVHLVPPPVTCPHDYMTPCSSSSSTSTSGSSLMKGCCYSCFDSFVEDVVKMILDTRQPHWLRLGLH